MRTPNAVINKRETQLHSKRIRENPERQRNEKRKKHKKEQKKEKWRLVTRYESYNFISGFLLFFLGKKENVQ